MRLDYLGLKITYTSPEIELALNRIREKSQKGRKMIEKLEKSSKTINISLSYDNESFTAHGFFTEEVNIDMNQILDYDYLTNDPNIPSCPLTVERVLAHELFHAFNGMAEYVISRETVESTAIRHTNAIMKEIDNNSVNRIEDHRSLKKKERILK